MINYWIEAVETIAADKPSMQMTSKQRRINVDATSSAGYASVQMQRLIYSIICFTKKNNMFTI